MGAVGRSRRRRIAYRIILFTPLALVCALALLVAVRLVEMRGVRASDLAARQRRTLAERRDEPSADVSRRGIRHRDGTFVPLGRTADERVIWVFGASSVVLPTRESAFPARLEAALRRDGGRPVRVVNFGEVGATSFALLRMATEAFATEQPDLLLFYEGHNDYGLSYIEFVQPALWLIEGSRVLSALVDEAMALQLHVRARRLDDLAVTRRHANFLRRANVEPALLQAVQRAGLVHVDADLTSRIDANVVERFRQNVAAIVALAHARGVPVLLLTPTSNLEIVPYGAGAEARDLYDRAHATADRAVRADLLRRARDLDAFNYAMRAKSGVGRALLAMRGAGTDVFELEPALEAAGVPLDGRSFFDTVHFRPPVHEVIAGLLAARVRALWSAPPAPPPP